MTRTKKTVLTFTTHPADAFDMAGGTLALHSRAGDRVVVVSLTAGARSHAPHVYGGDKQVEMTEQDEAKLLAETIEVKKKEFQKACDVAGAEMILLDYEDEPFVLTQQAILEVAELYRKIRPDILITHHKSEIGNHDHPDGGLVSLRAVTTAARWLKGSSQAPHLIPKIYFYGNQFRPHTMRYHAALPIPTSHIIDVTSAIEDKTKMLQAFATQGYGGLDYTSKEYADRRFGAVEGIVGLYYGYRYAEEFMCFSPEKVNLLS